MSIYVKKILQWIDGVKSVFIRLQFPLRSRNPTSKFIEQINVVLLQVTPIFEFSFKVLSAYNFVVMKKLFRLFLLFLLTTPALAQTDVPYAMSPEENRLWLTTLKNSDKAAQFNLVRTRLIEKQQPATLSDSLDVPVLIVDGILIDRNISDEQRAFLSTQLTPQAVKIEVVEREPEKFYANKRFTGIIMIVITDKKANRKFRQLR